MRHSPRLMRLAIVAGIVLALAGTAAMASERGGCVVAEVPAPVVLPDGSVHPPGSLRLCFESRLNPSAEFHEVSTGGGPQGRFAGRRARAELDVDRPFVVFHRNDNDEWILIGILQPPRNRHQTPTRVQLVTPPRVRELAAIGMEERPLAEDEGFAFLRTDVDDESRILRLAAR